MISSAVFLATNSGQVSWAVNSNPFGVGKLTKPRGFVFQVAQKGRYDPFRAVRLCFIGFVLSESLHPTLPESDVVPRPAGGETPEYCRVLFQVQCGAVVDVATVHDKSKYSFY